MKTDRPYTVREYIKIKKQNYKGNDNNDSIFCITFQNFITMK